MASLITEVATNLQDIAIKKNITIETEIKSKKYPIQGDYYRLRQLLIIFLDNAIKYSDYNTTIHISVYANDGFMRIEIRDEGIGIPAEDLPYIWERFYKVDKTRGKSGAGSGLGLTIAKYLIEAHQGTVDVTSEIGKGTKIQIKLPLHGCEIQSI